MACIYMYCAGDVEAAASHSSVWGWWENLDISNELCFVLFFFFFYKAVRKIMKSGNIKKTKANCIDYEYIKYT